MHILFVGERKSRSHSLHLSLLAIGALFVLGCAALLATAWGGYYYAQSRPVAEGYGTPSPLVKSWQTRLGEQDKKLAQVREQAGQQIDALTLRLGEMQGRLLRLDALGQRLVKSGQLDDGEFDFSEAPAVGGPEQANLGESYTPPELSAMIDQLDAQLSDREQQLRLLDQLLSREQLEDERFVAGRPINVGWLSSHYGYRTDPFTGKRTWHDGVDLAGKDGSDIVAVASGVVTYSGDRYGYGNFIAIDHGDGLVTRYGHCRKLKVNAGDVVKKGEVIALMGSTGRSTGPHVHFEVHRHGKSTNPEKYIQRASR